MAARPQRTLRLAPEQRRRELLDAALDVVFDDGFDALTVEAVSSRAGVSRPVIYDHFGDLDRLLIALLDREEERAVSPLMGIVSAKPGADVRPEDLLAGSLEAFLGAVRQAPRTWRLILTPPGGGIGELRDRLQRNRAAVVARVRELVDWGVAQRGGPAGLDHELLAQLIVAGGQDAARLTLDHPRRYPPERIAALAHALVQLAPAQAPQDAPAAAVSFVAPEPRRAAQAPPGQRVPQAKRREQLLDVTLALLGTEGFDGLTVDAVARRAGVSRLVVYRSFANLQVLLVALLAREQERTRRQLDAILATDPAGRPPPDVLADGLRGFLEAVLRDPLTWRLALLPPESAPRALAKIVDRRRGEIARELAPLVQWALGRLPPDGPALDVPLVTRLVLTLGEQLGRLALEDPSFNAERLLGSTAALLRALPWR